MSFLSELVGRVTPPEMGIRLRDLSILPLYGVKR